MRTEENCKYANKLNLKKKEFDSKLLKNELIK